MFKSFNLCRKALFSTAMASAKEPRIFFGGLPIGYTEFAIKNLFKDCGEIKTVEFFRKDESGANKGYGTILFADENALNKALEMNEQQVGGRPMTIKAWEGEYKDAEANRRGTVNPKINFPPSEIIYIGNLRFDQDADELINIFAEMGNVISFRRPYDAVNKRSKG